MKKVTMLLLASFAMLTFNANAQFNLAIGKKATQSTNYNSSQGSAKLAVDGNTDGRWNSRSVTHTKDGGTVNPWWQVDLESIQYVKEILVWNRIDCCKKRLDNLVIYIHNGRSWERVNKRNHRYSPGIQYPLKFRVGKRARKVKIQLESPRGILSLAEVKVIGNVIKDTKRTVSNTVKNLENTGVILVDETRKGVKTISNEVKKMTPIFANARVVGKPKKCKGASFYDISTGKCWSCPQGYKRTVASINSKNACEKKGRVVYARAIKGGKGKGILGTDCPRGYFWDPNGNCYKCPDGYNRTAHPVISGKACSQKVNSSFTYAKPVGSAGCTNGIYDVGTDKCWTCPVRYKRTIFPVTGDKACEKVIR